MRDPGRGTARHARRGVRGRARGRGGELGTLTPGAEGAAAVLQLEAGDFTFGDTAGHEITGNRRFAPVLTVRAGRRWRPR